jgi:hypothetical protein
VQVNANGSFTDNKRWNICKLVPYRWSWNPCEQDTKIVDGPCMIEGDAWQWSIAGSDITKCVPMCWHPCKFGNTYISNVKRSSNSQHAHRFCVPVQHRFIHITAWILKTNKADGFHLDNKSNILGACLTYLPLMLCLPFKSGVSKLFHGCCVCCWIIMFLLCISLAVDCKYI